MVVAHIRRTVFQAACWAAHKKGRFCKGYEPFHRAKSRIYSCNRMRSHLSYNGKFLLYLWISQRNSARVFQLRWGTLQWNKFSFRSTSSAWQRANSNSHSFYKNHRKKVTSFSSSRYTASGFSVQSGWSPDAFFFKEALCMQNQLQKLLAMFDSQRPPSKEAREYIQYSAEVEQILRDLEAHLHESKVSDSDQYATAACICAPSRL